MAQISWRKNKKGDPMSDTPLIPELYLIMDLAKSPDPLPEFEAVRAVAPIISVLIKENENHLPTNALISTIQAHNIAVLLEDTEKVKQLGADGVHLTSTEEDAYLTAQKQLGGDHIIGINPKSSRHTAMEVAEKGASYIALEKLDDENDTNNTQETNKQPPNISWWISLFETPCIAWNITTGPQALQAQTAGADFLALAPSYWQQGDNTKSTIENLQTILTKQARS